MRTINITEQLLKDIGYQETLAIGGVILRNDVKEIDYEDDEPQFAEIEDTTSSDSGSDGGRIINRKMKRRKLRDTDNDEFNDDVMLALSVKRESGSDEVYDSTTAVVGINKIGLEYLLLTEDDDYVSEEKIIELKRVMSDRNYLTRDTGCVIYFRNDRGVISTLVGAALVKLSDMITVEAGVQVPFTEGKNYLCIHIT